MDSRPPVSGPPGAGAGIDPALARRWIDRWELQQERYAVDREERFTVVLDAVEHTVLGQDRPVIVDLGCGPGSLASRAAERIERAEVIGVDVDPFLLELGRARHGGRVRFVQARAGSPGWVEALGLSGPVDAVISTTALHYPSEPLLRSILADIHGLLRSDGLFVNADKMPWQPGLSAGLIKAIGYRRAHRSGALGQEDWDGWWQAIREDPGLVELISRRDRSGLSSGPGNTLTVREHQRILLDAGFRDVATVWQVGDDHVVIAVR